MNTKFESIKQLADDVSKQVTRNKDEWTRYLKTAARLYKYPFSEQLLIYAQRPDATACASIEVWNTRMRCWVNRGAKGIALIDADSSRPRLKYVYDVSDVRKLKEGSYPYLWKLREEHKDSVIRQLGEIYELAGKDLAFEERMIELAEQLANDQYEKLLSQISPNIDGSSLEHMDNVGQRLSVRQTLVSSIAYTLLSRCGADMDTWGDKLDFSHIADFDTLETVGLLGSATTEICRPILIEIRKTIVAYDKKHLVEEEKTLANTPNIEYNALKRKSEWSQVKNNINKETELEGENYGTEVQKERGLSDSKSDSERRAGGRDNQIRPDAGKIFEGLPKWSLPGNDPEGDIKRTFADDTGAGRAEDGASDRTDEGERGDNGADESRGSDALGSEDEQYPELSGGDREKRTDLQSVEDITLQGEAPEPVFTQLSLFPSFEEQVGTVAAAEAGMKYTMPAAFSLPQEELDTILRSGGGKQHSRKRIYAKYTEGRDAEGMVEFLKNEYGQTGKGFEIGGHPVAVWFDEHGMSVGYGTQAKEAPIATMNWEDVESHIRSMVENGTYMSASEAFLVDTQEKKRVANQIFFFLRDGMDEAPEEIGMKESDFPESEAALMELLSTHGGREKVRAIIEDAGERLVSGEVKLKWNFVKSPEYLLSEIADLDRKRLEFPLPDTLEVKQEDFITQDEIDYALGRGSGYSNGVFRIYDYFMEGHDKKETVAFLKNEYGIGGGSGGLPGNDNSHHDHDGKGIRLEKGSYGNPYANVLLNWNVVEKRLRELITEDKYLSAEGKEKYREYKEEQARAARQREFDRLEHGAEVFARFEGTDEVKPEENKLESIDTQAAREKLENGEAVPDKGNAVNFHISNDVLGVGTPKEKFRRNVEAIKLLEQIEGEHRYATPQEQEILSQYVGWGGLADAFDESKTNWTAEYQELKNLLSLEEYRMARESTLNAHYTSPAIIRSMYDSIEKMGFTQGNILEPSMGIGNFFGMVPDSMKESRLYGVELDGITGRIAKQLYPQADVQIKGFEKTDYPNDFFDIAIGNVPFGQYKVADRAYDKNNFLIHDYFFAKTLDKVRPGGVVAFITSKGTMDKASPEVRRYLAQRADLLGAVRLPNTAFKANAGTEVTSDILFFQKRDRMVEREPDWVHLSENADRIAMNSYFAEHPEQIVGKMEMVSGPYGMESTCKPDESRPFEEQLKEAVGRITGQIDTMELDEELEDELGRQNIPADPNVKNFSYTVAENEVYYRENSVMKPVEVSDTVKERIKGMVTIRNCTQELIDLQLNDYGDTAIKEKQAELNSLYDAFSKKYGLINSQTNKRAFSQDSSYCLLCSLEKLDDEGNFKGKADMFTKRTIKKAEVVTSVDTASEALAVSLGEKAMVDLAYMEELTGKDKDTLTEELRGVIFQNPLTDAWETADEYLSGNVREKLEVAGTYAENHPEYAVNVQALTQVQPKELDASEIEVRIGATWIDTKYIEDFMRDTFETPEHLFRRDVIGVQFSNVTGEWNVKGKSADYGNSLVNMTYGTSHVNAYKILEDSLNLKDTRVYDTIEEDGKEKRVLNKKETMIASQKQEAIREAFKDWVFRDPERRQVLVAKYNELFNSTRPREYDGSHLKFPGMTPDIELKPHQKNAVAHVLYGNNTLLAHCVGAGKTFEMTAAAMESKRLGLCQKSLFVVPNHLTEQWASDFLRLYPGANILAATKKDFEPANRKKFCSRIATGDYDAVIIGHSQFEKIPLSVERQTAIVEKQIDEIELAIKQTKADKGERYTIKQMEKSRKALQVRLDKLNDQTRKDNVVTFEQLGVDRLFVDESHNYKNLFLYTKMRNVAGIAQTEAQKSSDMFAKCQYLDEITGGKGVTFATGTPISNSMTELYTNMRYLQYGTLQKLGLGHFDAWAASFGETQTAIELAPEGTGYRAKTRFAKFFNLPELISLFKESADIQTPDMLKLPVPEAEYENVVLKPSEFQKDMVASLAERAEAVRDRRVDAYIDNMLKITNDGRKLALDQRLINDMLPDDENSKAATCVNKAFEIWEETKEQKSTQLIFCDLSTPKGDGTFNVYEDIKNKLMEKGVQENEIAFIHDANTELRKAELFAKVRSGQVRFLLGSTAKMGAGTNVQDRLIALHHLDVPWRPSDIEQQEGRILRQGNLNPKVKIFRYVTEGTFDSYSWQLIENKQKFIGQIMTSKSPVRSCEDVDEAALSYAEVKALATGNPYIKEKMDLDIQVSKLKLMKANHTSQKYKLEDNITQHYPQQIAIFKERIDGFTADMQKYEHNKPLDKEQFAITIGGKAYTDKKEAGTAIIAMCKEIKGINASADVGEYLGFKLNVTFDSFNNRFVMNVKGAMSHPMEVGTDPLGNITRINNALEAMPAQLEEAQTKLANVEHQLETAKAEVNKPFAQEAELSGKLERLAELNALLNIDEKGEGNAFLDEKEEEPDILHNKFQLDEKKIEDYDDLSNEELMEKIHNMENEKGISLGRAVNNCCDRNEMKALIECINCEDSVLDEYLNMIQPIYPAIYKKAVTNPNWRSSAERLQIFGAARQLLDQSAIQADKMLQNDKVEGVRLPGC